MDVASSNNSTEQTVLAQLQYLVAEAKGGNAEVLPQIREMLDTYPELPKHYGNLTEHVESRWLDLLAGDDACVRESLQRTADEQRADLLAEGDSSLERLLVDRVIVGMLMTRFFDAALVLTTKAPESRVRYLQQQLDRAQRRHIAAIKALAEVRKLLPSAAP